MPNLIQDLGSRIPRTPTNRGEDLVVRVEVFCDPEVGDDEVVILARPEEEVLRFQVPVDNVVRVEVGYSVLFGFGMTLSSRDGDI